MHVLMIGPSAEMLRQPHGDDVERHIAYAERIGRLSMVAYNPASAPLVPHEFSERLTIYPANARSRYLFPWRAYRVAAQIHRADPVDVVSTQDPFACGLVGVLLKWRFGLPLNMQSHSTFFTNPHWIRERPVRNRVFNWLGRLLIQQADTHRLLTHYEKQVYINMGISADRIRVQSVPVRLDQFAAAVPDARLAELRAALNLAPGVPVALWVGLPVAFKHIDLLLNAFALVHETLPTACLLLAGDFTAYPQYIARADPAYVRYAGRVSHAELPAYYALADLYVHSSYYEGVPRVFLEALAAARPIVSTRHVGAEAVIRDGETGLLTDHTPEAFSAAILALLTDPARARAMGAAGRADVMDRFDYERGMRAIVQCYQDTLDRHATRD